MPAWIISALSLIGGLGGRALPALTRQTPGVLAGAVGGTVFSSRGETIDVLTGEAKPKRRRRRRALTASDRADIAFIAGLLGPTAGRNFAITVATRTS